MSNFIELDPEQIRAVLETSPSNHQFSIIQHSDGKSYYIVKTCAGFNFVVGSKSYENLEDAQRALETRSRLSRAFTALIKSIRENAPCPVSWALDRSECL